MRAACAEVVDRTTERRSCLIFAAGIAHATHLVAVLQELGQEAEAIFGDTPLDERDERIARFRRGTLKYLVNVAVLTTGFDAPQVDCVALMRPTLSAGLYYQMVGRGFRAAQGKNDCLVLDFGGNILRHGPVDAVGGVSSRTSDEPAPAKECPECQSIIAAGYTACPTCGYVFPPPQLHAHAAEASTAGIITGQATTSEHPVRQVYYSVHTKRGADEATPKTLRVEYEIGWRCFHSEWICIEHAGWARQKAEEWWRRRSRAPVPLTAAEAVAAAEAGALCTTTAITVRSVAGEPYDRIIAHQLGEKPPWRQMGDVDDPPDSYASTLSDDEVPF
ncbi:MAG: hypothetical protein H0V44_05125 [Planctomycetes bacterium]|nr:hypothetical protein [Planctomycetota bacterium]